MSRQLTNDTKQVLNKKKQPGTGNKHEIEALPAWERLFKKIVWKQLGTIKGKRIFDFGSGEGITAILRL